MVHQIPPNDYDDWTVPQIETHIESVDYTEGEYEDLRAYEEDNRNRSTALEAIDEELNDFPTKATVPVPEDDTDSVDEQDSVGLTETATVASKSEPEVTTVSDTETDSASTEAAENKAEDSGSEPEGSDNRVKVVPNGETRMSAAGMVFNNQDEGKITPLTPRVKTAIEEGYLRVVEE